MHSRPQICKQDGEQGEIRRVMLSGLESRLFSPLSVICSIRLMQFHVVCMVLTVLYRRMISSCILSFSCCMCRLACRAQTYAHRSTDPSSKRWGYMGEEIRDGGYWVRKDCYSFAVFLEIMVMINKIPIIPQYRLRVEMNMTRLHGA